MSKPAFPQGITKPQMDFRHAQISDIPLMMEIIRDAQASLRSQGVDQWQNGYPNEEQLQKDIHQQGSYVLTRDGAPIAMMALLPGPDPTYAVIDGAWLTAGEYYVIHRLAVSSLFKGVGTAARMLSEAEAICHREGIPALRVDTHHDNKPMQRFLAKGGFTPCGNIRLADGSPRIAFEKML